MKKKIVAFLMAVMLFMTMGISAGCSDIFDPDSDTEEIDATKTQLYIGNVNQGFGEAWLYAVKERFEEFYKNEPFEEGKKGVQVIIEETTYGPQLISTVKGSRSEVLFTESFPYYQFVNQGLALDISDAITTPLTEFGETQSIYDKMTGDAQEYYNASETEGDYEFYALPFYETYFTIIYNADLFADFRLNEQGGSEGLYMTTDGTGAYNDPRSWTKDPNASNISPGPDGDPSTAFDNGLPATYDEFFVLCERALKGGLIPLSWNGASSTYPGYFLMNLVANASGYKEMMLNFTFDGTSETLVDSVNYNTASHTAELSYRSPKQISMQEGYELAGQAGKYYALEFLDRVYAGGYHNAGYLGNGTVSHIEAQNAFIRTEEFGGNINGKDTLMLIDGTWWMNEAGPTFDSLVGIYGEEAGEMSRNFKIMPLPMPRENFKRPGEEGTETVFFDKHMAACFVNANIAEGKKDLAKKFVRFCHTNESIIEFTKYTSTIKPYTVTYTEADLEGFTPYARSIIEMKQHSKTVSAGGKNSIFVNDSIGLTTATNIWAITGQNHPETALASGGGYNAKTYFDALKEYNSKTLWDSKYSQYWS